MKTPAKAVNKAYEKSIKNLYKQFFTSAEAGLFVFIEYLTYRRDAMILQDYDEATINTCNTAIAEFCAYSNCEDHAQKQLHWNSFCELLKHNMEDWLRHNDSI